MQLKPFFVDLQTDNALLKVGAKLKQAGLEEDSEVRFLICITQRCTFYLKISPQKFGSVVVA